MCDGNRRIIAHQVKKALKAKASLSKGPRSCQYFYKKPLAYCPLALRKNKKLLMIAKYN
jgi:hypothetical protein